MDQQQNNSKQKFVVAFVMLAAVVIVALGVSFFKDKESDASAVMSGTTSTSAGASSANQATQAGSSSNATYKDGTYSADGTYLSPGGDEKISVSLTIKGGVVTDTTINQVANNGNSAEYQARFKDNYKSYVIGKALKSISLSRVSGSSLTSGGFNAALETIKSQAKA